VLETIEEVLSTKKDICWSIKIRIIRDKAPKIFSGKVAGVLLLIKFGRL
jgi:hypothetical protein